MSVPTVAVICTANDQNGNPVSGASYKAKLDQTEIYNGFVVPEVISAVADSLGVAVLHLWPNELGVAGSLYTITATNPETGKKFLNTTVSVPNSATCRLEQIIVAQPYPSIDASAQALIAAQSALSMATAQADIATTEAAIATDAAMAAGVATASSLAHSQESAQHQLHAALAADKAENFTTIAATHVISASAQASAAVLSAFTASTQADISSASAASAHNSACMANANAVTTIMQAGFAAEQARQCQRKPQCISCKRTICSG